MCVCVVAAYRSTLIATRLRHVRGRMRTQVASNGGISALPTLAVVARWAREGDRRVRVGSDVHSQVLSLLAWNTKGLSAWFVPV